MNSADELPPRLLGDVAQVVEARLGLYFPPARRVDLERGLRTAAPDMGFESIPACARWLVANELQPSHIEALAVHLTIGETYFFRDAKAFAALHSEVLPALFAERHACGRPVRIWSAGCCTGEEAYSIAICVQRGLGAVRSHEVTILGTDVNPAFLRKARGGVYGRWSFRELPPEDRARFFRETTTGQFEIIPEIRKMVTFSSLNLVDDLYPSAATNTHEIDVIFCRNILMYFSREQALQVAQRLQRALVNGGWLFVSPSEASQELFADLTHADLPGTTAYRKSAVAPDATPRDDCPASTERRQRGLLAQPIMLLPEGRFSASSGASAARPVCGTSQAVVEYERGLELQEAGAIDAALTCFERALHLDPQLVVAYIALAALAQKTGREDQAQNCFANARRLLENASADAVLPASGGLTAARMLTMLPPSQKAGS